MLKEINIKKYKLKITDTDSAICVTYTNALRLAWSHRNYYNSFQQLRITDIKTIYYLISFPTSFEIYQTN